MKTKTAKTDNLANQTSDSEVVLICELCGGRRTKMELTPTNVENIFVSSLFDDETNTSNAIIVEGIMAKFGFDPTKIETNKENIISMLDELPDEFRQGKGGGMSFLNACNDKHGNLWTGMHDIMDKLFVLGMAIKRVQYLMPREMWEILPGGMPYYVILEPTT